MDRFMPPMPEVPDVVPFEDEPAREVLRAWCEKYAESCVIAALDTHSHVVYLNKEGVTARAEAEAAGGQWVPYSWYFFVQPADVPAPPACFRVGSFSANFPPRDRLIGAAVTILEQKITEAYVTAEETARGYRVQKESLLAISMGVPK